MIDIFEQLKDEYQTQDGKVKPSFYEEFCDQDGVLDYRYLAKKYKRTLSKQEAQRLIATTFGTFSLEPEREYKNEVTRAMFEKYYEFGRHADVRGWIETLYIPTGLVLTRKRLYEYIYGTTSKRD